MIQAEFTCGELSAVSSNVRELNLLAKEFELDPSEVIDDNPGAGYRLFCTTTELGSLERMAALVARIKEEGGTVDEF